MLTSEVVTWELQASVILALASALRSLMATCENITRKANRFRRLPPEPREPAIRVVLRTAPRDDPQHIAGLVELLARLATQHAVNNQ